LSGAPAVTLVSSAWLPNRDGVEWFLREVWPAVHASLPGAELHLFASGPTVRAPGVTAHEPPADIADAFAPGSILVVPLRIGSGVRIRILEAWARRVPVVATAEAAAGLTDRDGELVRLASTPAGFAEAFRALAGASLAREALVRAARLKLEADHDPVETARALGRVYDAAAARRARALSTKMSAMPPPEEPRS
jgi:glycosyltransferase involved in cell wall biosynthesis